MIHLPKVLKNFAYSSNFAFPQNQVISQYFFDRQYANLKKYLSSEP